MGRMRDAGRWTRDARGVGSDARARAAAAGNFLGQPHGARRDALWMPDAGRWLTSMIMRSVFSLRAGTVRGPYTAASTTERSADGEREGRESGAEGARRDSRGGTRRRRVGRTLFPSRGPVRARQKRTLRPELPHHRRRAPVRAHRGRHIVSPTPRAERECRARPSRLVGRPRNVMRTEPAPAARARCCSLARARVMRNNPISALANRVRHYSRVNLLDPTRPSLSTGAIAPPIAPFSTPGIALTPGMLNAAVLA